MKKIFVILTLLFGMLYMFLIEILRFLKALFTGKKYKHTIQEVAEETIPEVYFQNLILEFNHKIKNKIFSKSVLFSIIDGHDKDKLNSQDYMVNNKVNTTKVKKEFYSLILLNLFCSIRDIENKSECTQLLDCFDKTIQILNSDNISFDNDFVNSINEMRNSIREIVKDKFGIIF